MKQFLVVIGFIAALLSGAAFAQFSVGGVTGGAPTANVSCYGDADGKIRAYADGWTAADCGVYTQVCNVTTYSCPPANTLCLDGTFCGTGQKCTISNPADTADCVSEATNQAPLLADFTCPDGAAGAQYSCTVQGSDPDNNPLTYTASTLPPGLSINANTGEISGIPTSSGSMAAFTVTVTDTYNETATGNSNSINMQNSAPVFLATTCPTATVGGSYSCPTGASDTDGHTLTYSKGTGPSWLSVDASTGNLTATTVGTAIGNVVISVTDNYDTVTSSNISIALNNKPTISTVSCGAGVDTSAYSCSVSASDTDSDSLSYQLVSGPSWASISSSGVIAGTAILGTTSNITVEVSDGTDTVTSNSFSITIDPNTATILANTASTITTDDVDNLATLGVANAVVNDLKTNNNCGAGGNENCLAAFNAQKASSSCTLQGGASATGTQMEAYIGCVMIEHHTASVASVSIPGSSTVTTGCNGGSEPINLTLPSTCGHPQWNCNIQSGPSTWSISNLNELVVPSNHANGSETVTIRMTLGIYSPAYTKDVTKTYNVAGAISGATNGMRRYSNGSDENAWAMWNSCIAKGGRMATKTEAEALGNVGGNHVFAPNNGQDPGNRSGGNWQRWPSSSSETTCKLGNSYGRMMYGQNRWWICGSGVNQTIYYTCTDLPSC